jgi:site-specific DNA recombinase
MATRALRGDNVNAIRRWLDQEGAPLPRGQQWRRSRPGWGYTSVERILRNPVLAGMTLHNPGQDRGGTAREVLRDPDGSPHIRPELAVITLAQREAMLHLLDNKTHHAAISRSERVTTPRILSDLAWCAHCDRLLNRATAVQRPVMKCPVCAHQISMRMLMPYLVRRLLDERGALPMYALA